MGRKSSATHNRSSKLGRTTTSQSSSSRKCREVAGVFPSYLLDDAKNPCQPYTAPAAGKLETLVPGYVWVISNFFSLHECRNWVQYIEASVELEHTKQRGTRYLAARECFRAHRDDPITADRLFRRLQACLHRDNRCADETALLPPTEPVSCNPNLRVYKYLPGHSFGKHVDESVSVGSSGRTRLTMLVYLSACEGGATRFDVPPGYSDAPRSGGGGGGTQASGVAFAPTVGSLLLHLHGDDCLLHQGDPVLRGTKYVLRSDVVYAS